MPQLEVIAMSLADAITAEKGGAASVEIITNLAVGGLTPELDLVRQIVDSVQVETHVIVRPHADGFVYDATDKQVMLATVRELAKLPITSVVIGALTADGHFDFDLLHSVTNEIEPQRITIHRAVDHVQDPFATLQKLSETISRVLCSGAPSNVYDGRETMAEWVKALGDKVHFKCGGGITFENVGEIQKTVNAPMIHVGSAVRAGDSVVLEQVQKLVALLRGNQKGNP
jgi:copper homeostasis protein